MPEPLLPPPETVSPPASHAPAATRSVLEPARPGEFDLFALVLLLRLHRLRTLLFALTASLLMAAYTLAVKPIYTATASVIIPQPVTSSAGLALQAASGLDLLGGGYEVFLDILHSELVMDRLIDRYNLREHYGTTEMGTTELTLASNTTLSAAKEGFLQIAVRDADPHLAADLANSYVTELDWVNQHLAVTAAGQRRRFYEQQLIKEKDELADAEVALAQAQRTTGVLEPQSQAQASVAATEQTRAQLRAREVELGALQQGATAQNPEVARVQAEITSLRAQLHAQETSGGETSGTPFAQVPERALVIVRRTREVKFHEALFDVLSKEFELAKQQEGKDISMVEPLDRAPVPERKSWPPRTSYTIGAFFIGAVLGIVFTLLERFVRGVARNPANRERLKQVLE